MADVDNADLFEVLADTFATIAREDFQAGKVEVAADGTKYPYDDWDATDEVHVDDDSKVIGSWRDTKPRLERFYIDGITEGGDIDFDREPDGSVTVLFYKEDHQEEEPLNPHELTDFEKAAILDACLAGFSS